MGFIDTIKGIRASLAKEIRVFNGGNTTPNSRLPTLPSWLNAPNLGMPRGVNIVELRQYAKSPWVQMVVNAICKQIMTTDWHLVPSKKDDDIEKYSMQIEKVTTFLNNPNRNGDEFWDIWIPYLRDVLELDAGVIFKGRNIKGELVELFAYDGSRFLFNIDEKGIINEQIGFYQYSFKYIASAPIPFRKDEIIYGRVNTNTEYYPYGWSPLQSIVQEVELMIQSTRFNKERFKNSNVPDGIVSVPMDKEQMSVFKNAWETEIKGRPHKLLFHNTEANFTPLAMTNKDMEWLEGQKWYFHLVFAAYGLSPQEVGFYENSNKSTGESQERITVKNAIKPYLKLIENNINKDIIPELTGNDLIKFEWTPEDDVAEKVKHDQIIAKLNANVLTINEVRAMEGLEPVEWGNQPMALTFQQTNSDKKQQSEEKPKQENKPLKEKPKNEEPDKQKKEVSKMVNAGDDMIEEAEDYESFLKRRFNQWEKEIFSFLNETVGDEIKIKDIELYMEKSFGEFIRQLVHSVNTIGFKNALIAVIKSTYKQGINDAEKELKIDIGFSPSMMTDVNTMADRQLEGFYIDGKRWNGIKGVADDVQKDVSQLVRDAMVNRTGMTQLRKDIQEKLDITKNRAEMIARTETTRFTSMSKIKSYKDSGVVKYKKWDAAEQDRTCPNCLALNGQEVELDDYFELDGVKVFSAPFHPMCRCTTTAVLK